jgi:hypothetical protein
MKFLFIAVIFLFSFFASACHQKISHQNIFAEKKQTDTTVFYPVADFLKKQIQTVDSTPFYIYRIRIIDGKKDSAKISAKQFDSLAKAFVAFDISDSAIKKNYKENVFEDASTKSLTFNYTTKDSTMFIQSIDALLDEDDQHVKRIFMTTFENKDGNDIYSKMGWKPNRNFYINRDIHLVNGKEATEQNMIVWNNRE